MECKIIREKLSAYLEGAVSPEEKRVIGEHLPACQPCRRALEDLKKTELLLKGLEKVEPPAWFKQKVMARIRVEQEAKKSIIEKLFYPLHVKIPIEAFATVLIAIVAIYIFKGAAPEMKRVSSLSPGPVVLTPGEKAISEKDLSSGEKGGLARSVEEREKQVTEEKKGVVAKVKEGEPKAEATKPLPSQPPSQAMLAKKEHEDLKQAPAGALTPGEKAVPERGRPPADKGDLAQSEDQRDKGLTEQKKTVVAKAKEGEPKAEAIKPYPPPTAADREYSRTSSTPGAGFWSGSPVAPPAGKPVQKQSPQAPASQPLPSIQAFGPAPRVLYVRWPTVSLREGPGLDFKPIMEVKKGTVLSVLEEKGPWLRIRLEDGQEGWIGKATTSDTP